MMRVTREYATDVHRAVNLLHETLGRTNQMSLFVKTIVGMSEERADRVLPPP